MLTSTQPDNAKKPKTNENKHSKPKRTSTSNLNEDALLTERDCNREIHPLIHEMKTVNIALEEAKNLSARRLAPNQLFVINKSREDEDQIYFRIQSTSDFTDVNVMLSHFRHLQTLSLSSSLFVSMRDEELMRLARGLKYLTALETLTLELPNGKTYILDVLNYGLRSLANLRVLNISVKTCRDTWMSSNRQNLATLKETLKHLTSLQVFTIDLTEFTWRTYEDTELLPLSEILQYLVTCRAIKLTIASSYLKYDGLKQLETTLAKLTTLQSVVLDLSRDGDLSIERIISLLSLSKHLVGLRLLDIRYCCKNSTKRTRNQGQKLKHSTSGCNVALNLSGIKKVSDEDLEALGQRLTSFPNLKGIDLNFRSCSNLTIAGISSLVKSLKCFPDLEVIKLDLGWHSYITDEKFQTLCEDLKYFVAVKVIGLNVGSCNDITDQGVTNLSQCLGSMLALQDVSFDFSYCTMLTNNALAILSQCMNKIPYLRTISLNFERCGNIDDQGLASLGQGLKDSKSLVALSLKFSFCHEIKMQGLVDLTKNLCLLPVLQSISLDIKGCAGIGKEHIAKVQESMKSTVDLRILI